MNRRNFFKTVTGFVAGIFAAALPSKAKNIFTYKEIIGKDIPGTLSKRSGTRLATKEDIEALKRGDCKYGWKFYINDKEVDGSRAVDEFGCLRFPFEGAKHRDMCKAQSPNLKCYGQNTTLCPRCKFKGINT